MDKVVQTRAFVAIMVIGIFTLGRFGRDLSPGEGRQMFLDWLVFGGLVCATAALLNNWRFRARPATISLAVALSIVTFIVGVVALSVAGVTYYDTVRGMWEVRLPRNPVAAVHVIVPAAFALLFYFLLRKGNTKIVRALRDSRLTGVNMEDIVRSPDPPPPVSDLTPINSSHKMQRLNFLETNHQQAEHLLRPSPSVQASASPAEEFWSEALSDFDGPSRRPGLWAKVFAEAQGNESVAKASYLRHRAVELEQKFHVRVGEQQREIAEQEARRIQERKEAEALKAQHIEKAGNRARLQEKLDAYFNHKWQATAVNLALSVDVHVAMSVHLWGPLYKLEIDGKTYRCESEGDLLIAIDTWVVPKVKLALTALNDFPTHAV